MPALTKINDIPNLTGLPFVDAMLNGGDVGCRIIERTILCLDAHGLVLPFTVAVAVIRSSGGLHWVARKDTNRAVTFTSKTVGLQLFNQRTKRIVIGTLSHPVIKSHPEAIIHRIESFSGEFETTRPDRSVFRVTLLKFHQLRTTLIFDHFVFFRGIGSGAIKSEQFLPM